MKKLYYEDCHLKEFSARVTGCTPAEGGWEITLDATAFYPEGGGQPYDTGTLGTVRVLSVRERGEEIIHLCDGELPVGSEVTGLIHWQRRLDLMQQHTGEHILSGLIHSTYGYHNVGFHMGAQTVEIDFDGMLTWEQAMELEQKANAAIWENLPVECFVPPEADLANIPYRSKRALDWPVRIVRIPGIDCCACCGVHTAFTGEVGIVKILSCAKFHSGVRLEIVCGSRAYRYLSEIFLQNRQISQLLSAKMPETYDAVAHLSQVLSAEKQRSAALQNQVFSYIAESYVNRNNVLHFAEDLTGGELRLLAEAIAGSCRGFAAVFSQNSQGYGYCLAKPDGDLRELCKEMNRILGGRGGGKPPVQQGSVTASRQEIADFFGKITE